MGDSKVTLGVALLPLTSLLTQGQQAAAAPSDAPSSHHFAPQQFLPAQQPLGGRSLSQPIADGTLVPATVTTPEFSEYIAQAVPPITPQGDGTGTVVSPDGNTFTITGGTQAGQNLFHRFDQFNLNAGQVAHFLTHPQIEAVFSQVAGGDASYIDGLLQVSGSSADLFVLNPAGVLLGPNARLDLGGSFTAASADWVSFGQGSTEAWLNVVNGQNYGELLETAQGLGFSAVAPGSVINQGQLAVQSGESLRLVGGQVVNQGGLTAPGGEVTAVAVSGNSVVRFSDSQQLLTLDIAATPENLNTLEAEPMALPQLLAGQPQAQEAASVRVHSDGSVSLLAEASPGSLTVSGQVDVSQTVGPGGQVNLLGETVQVTQAVVDASGEQGGTIRIGGAFQGEDTLPGSQLTQVDADTVLRADGMGASPTQPLDAEPEGGNVIVWSDGTTEFAGTASALGQGVVETSGQQGLNIAPTARVDTSGETPDGATANGNWLLDPATLTVDSTGNVDTIAPATIVTNLQTTDVTLQADNRITVAEAIDASGNAAGAGVGDLTLDAPTIDLNQQVTLQSGRSLSGTATIVNVGANGSVIDGVDVVTTAGTVNLAAATYREGQEIVLDRQITLQGQGAGQTVLSGDAAGDGNAAGNQGDNHRVLELTNSADSSVISDLTVADGVFQGNADGGGLSNRADDVRIENSRFERNRVLATDRDGGAIHTQGDRLLIQNTVFDDNHAADDGGAIDILRGSVEIIDSTFTNNSADSASDSGGGAIDVDPDASLTITRGVLANNVSQHVGGAIEAEGDLTISGTQFSNNIAQQEGGAIAIGRDSLTTIADATFVDNQAEDQGGAISYQGRATSRLTVTGGSFEGNRATSTAATRGDGGALYLESDGLVNIQGTRFERNITNDDGGAIAALNTPNLTLTDVTLADNQAVADDGGAIYLDGDSVLTLNGNSTFTNNRAAEQGGAVSLKRSAEANISEASFTGNTSDAEGGAISIQPDGRLSLTNGSFISNQSDQSGGAIFNEGQLTVSRTEFRDNEAEIQGGAVANQGDANANITISQATFTNNRAIQQSGGAVYLDSRGTNSIRSSTFTDNRTDGYDGGAIGVASATAADITDGTFINNQAAQYGGAIDVQDDARVAVTNSRFTGNTAAVHGGGIDNRGSLTVQVSSFEGNRSNDGNGGAIATRTATADLTIIDSSFSDNQTLSTDASRGRGGAIWNDSSGTTRVVRSTFQENRANAEGGAIASQAGTLILDTVTLQNNQALLGGGALLLSGSGQTQILSSTLDGNESETRQGGAIRHFGGHQLDIARSTLSNNITAWNGAAIDSNPSLPGSTISITDSTLSGNISRDLGGALSLGAVGAISLNNVTVANNQASNGGGGLANLFGGTLTLQNTIVAGNISPVNADIHGPFTSLGNNLVQTRGSSTGYVASDLADGTDPGLGPLADNGGPTQTHALSFTSPALDQANGSATAFDQRGLAAVNQRDIGAYELDNRLTVIQSGENQSTVVNTPFAAPLQLQVVDSVGGALSGLSITFAAPGTGASATLSGNASLVLVTDASGAVSVPAIANTTAGTYDIVATSTALPTSTFQLTNLPDAAAQLLVLNGDNQTTTVNTPFTNDLRIQVSDQFGNPVPNATINLLPPAGASVNPANTSLVTDATGQAATGLNANTIAGGYELNLSSASGGLSSRIRLENVPDVPDRIDRVGGDGQSTLVNTAFADNLVVQVFDQFGNPVPDAIVSFTPPAAGPSAVADAVRAQTNGVGQGETRVSANAIAGSYTVTATAGSAQNRFSLTNLPTPTLPAPQPPVPTPPTPQPPAPQPVPEPIAPQFADNFVNAPESHSLEKQPLATVPSGMLRFFDAIALQEIDSSFSQEYSDYWGFTRSNGATLKQTQEILAQAEASHSATSAVLYAFFVPQSQSADYDGSNLRQKLQGQKESDDDRLLLVLLPSQGQPVTELVDITRKEVLQQAKLFRMAVSDPEDNFSYRPLAQQMYQWLLAPVEPDVQRLQLDNLMYVLDAGLRTVPLAAMMNGDEFAVERYGLSIIPSVDLLETDFATLPTQVKTLAAGADQFETLNDLPAVPIELDAIAASQQSADILFNESFTQENLVRTQRQMGSQMLHLATHAEFNAGDLASSYLQFWDSQLTFDQLSGLGWDELELLILSACATAISSPEAELGFAGLAAATGVESSIGSLWNVSDVGTLALMAEFYGQLSQTPLRFSALQRAQVSLLRGQTNIDDQVLATEQGNIDLPAEWNLPDQADFSHPFYWAGFTLVGNPWW